jgi:DNA-binding HxlR family transcriptional regulator
LYKYQQPSNIEYANIVAMSAPVSNIDVLEAISDQLSMDIITAISNDVTNSDNLMQILDITPKRYYSRTSRLLNIGLVSRRMAKLFSHLSDD